MEGAWLLPNDYSDEIKTKNRLLAVLSPEEYQRLVPHMKVVKLSLKQVLHYSGTEIDSIYFPHRLLVSLIAEMEDGSTVEVGLVGGEGVVGVSAFLGDGIAVNNAVVQAEGEATQIPVQVLRAEFDRGGTLQRLLLRYMQTLYNQVSRSAACNRLHTLEQRLARWLLLVADSIESDVLPTTHEFLSHMLGVRRSGVTEAVKTLQTAGIIQYTRGQICILDRGVRTNFL